MAGIGNAYSDEILHAARLLPFRKRSSLATEEVDELYAAMRTTLARAIDVLRERVPPTFEKQVRDFLAVHDKGGQPCPALRDDDHRDQAGRVHHVLSAGAASAEPVRCPDGGCAGGPASGDLEDLADGSCSR